MLSFSELQKLVNFKISKLKLEFEPKGLYQPIQYILSVGGKRIRPSLALAAANLFQDDITSYISPALALELFHNFTLLHDDIMDKADIRRNRPTVHKKWNENTAILSGDAMSIMAYELLVQAPEKNLKKILMVFNKTGLEVCEGQQYDMEFEKRQNVSVDEYLEMIRLKTSVLLAASLKIGALCAQACKNDAQLLYDYGLNLGMAFQLQDDYLDTFGDITKFGKKIGGDILANKKTYLMVKTLQLADNDLKKELLSYLNTTKAEPEQKILAVKAIYNKLSVNKMLKEKESEYYNKALEALDQLKVEDIKKLVLKKFAREMVHRDY